MNKASLTKLPMVYLTFCASVPSVILSVNVKRCCSCNNFTVPFVKCLIHVHASH